MIIEIKDSVTSSDQADTLHIDAKSEQRVSTGWKTIRDVHQRVTIPHNLKSKSDQFCAELKIRLESDSRLAPCGIAAMDGSFVRSDIKTSTLFSLDNTAETVPLAQVSFQLEIFVFAIFSSSDSQLVGSCQRLLL